MCGMKLLIHSQTSTVEPLKFGNGYVISRGNIGTMSSERGLLNLKDITVHLVGKLMYVVFHEKVPDIVLYNYHVREHISSKE